jgi:hypothetical protein
LSGASGRRRIAACSALVLTLSCRATTVPSLDDEARQYVRLAVALGERDPDALDFYAGPADAVADVRRDPPTLTAIRREAEMLARQVRKGPADEGSRRAPPDQVVLDARVKSLVADLTAIIVRVDLLTGTRRPYDQESVGFFGMAPAPIEEPRLDAIRSQIADIVGHSGRLVDRYVAFAARFTIPPDRLAAVVDAAVDECRRGTAAHVTLPPGERVTIEFVRDRPWSAFSRYLGDGLSVIQVNTDFRFTVDQALQVACHEGYPGHHTRNTLTAPRRDATKERPERSAQLIFSPEALVSEASAMLAADLAFSPDERLRVERDRLFPVAGLQSGGAASHIEIERLVGELQDVQADVARRYLDGDLEFARAVSELEERALVPHAEALVKYINQYRSYVTTYTAGRRAFAGKLATCAGATPSDDVRWRCFLQAFNPK